MVRHVVNAIRLGVHVLSLLGQCVTAIKELRNDEVLKAIATEKVDGTCCCVRIFNDKPFLWARFDRKPSKKGDRRFKKYQSQCRELNFNHGDGEKEQLKFVWNFKEDFKETPSNWIPASGVTVVDDNLYPLACRHRHI